MKLVFKNIPKVTLKTQKIFSPPVVLWNTNKPDAWEKYCATTDSNDKLDTG